MSAEFWQGIVAGLLGLVALVVVYWIVSGIFRRAVLEIIDESFAIRTLREMIREELKWNDQHRIKVLDRLEKLEKGRRR